MSVGKLIKGLQGLGRVQNPYLVHINPISGLTGESTDVWNLVGFSGVNGSPTWWKYTDTGTGQEKFLVAYAWRPKTGAGGEENVFTGDAAPVKKNVDAMIMNFQANIAPYKDRDLFFWDKQSDIEALLYRKGFRGKIVRIPDPNGTGATIYTPGISTQNDAAHAAEVAAKAAAEKAAATKAAGEKAAADAAAAAAAAASTASPIDTTITTEYSVESSAYQPGPFDQFNSIDWKVKLGLVAGIIGGIGAAVFLGGRKRR